MGINDFTKIEEAYDCLFKQKMGDLEELALGVLISWKPDSEQKVCDVGAGTGLGIDLLENAGWRFKYTGIEPSGLCKQLEQKVSTAEEYSAIFADSDYLKSQTGKFDAVTYFKSLHEILISELLEVYQVETNAALHEAYLKQPGKYLSKKQIFLDSMLEISISALRPTGQLFIADMYYPQYLSDQVVDASVSYVHEVFRHLNYKEQTISVQEIEKSLTGSSWQIVDRRETAKRRDPNIKTHIYTLIIKNTDEQ